MAKIMKSGPRSGIPQTILVFLVQFSIFLAISRFRLVDGDEGFYLLTSRLVTEGKLPYHDFLLTQMPLLPYVYGVWMRFTGMTWLSARLLSAILAAALGTALYSEVRRQTARDAAGLLAALLFVSCTHVFAWLTVVKTYALSTLLLFLAYRAVIRYSAGRSVTWCTAAGLTLGASVDVRLYFAGLMPVFLWWIYGSTKIGSRMAAFLYFLGGCALAMMPNLYLLARDPQVYFFDNLGFHAVRNNQGLIGGLADKAMTVARLFLTTGDGNGVQVTLLFFASILAIRSGIATRSARLALTLGLVLSFISLLPSPPYEQYFCVTVPFFILFVVCSMSPLLHITENGREKRYLLAACGAILVFVVSAIPDYQRFLTTGDRVIGIDGRAPNFRISAIRAVSQAIDEQIRPGERVMSLWPGYIFESRAEPFAGLENNSATYFADRLSPAEQARYHILSLRGIQTDIAAHGPRLVVVGNQRSMSVLAEPFEKVLVRSGYRVVREIGDSKLWIVP
jgi:Dolichyl-phosphate-mannose-protein mannosyltransferase